MRPLFLTNRRQGQADNRDNDTDRERITRISAAAAFFPKQLGDLDTYVCPQHLSSHAPRPAPSKHDFLPASFLWAGKGNVGSVH